MNEQADQPGNLKGEWSLVSHLQKPNDLFIHIGGPEGGPVLEFKKGWHEMTPQEQDSALRIVKAVNMLSALERLKYVREEETNPHLAIEDRIETAECSLRGWNTVQYKIDMHNELVVALKEIIQFGKCKDKRFSFVTSEDRMNEFKELLKQAENK